jgi:hypothetical protein
MAVAYFVNSDGSIRDFTPAEIAAIGIETYDIDHGGFPTHTRGPDGGTLKATYFINYNMFERFVCYMLGACKSFTDGSGNFRISRMLPQTWPGKPQIAAVKIDSATGHQFDTDNSDELLVPTYNFMKVVITFQQLPYSLKSDADTVQDESQRYFQVMPSTSDVQMLSLPGGVMRYATSGGGTLIDEKQIPYGVGFPIPTITISRKMHRIPIDCWGPGSILYTRVFGNVPAGVKPWAGSYNVDVLFPTTGPGGDGGYPQGYALFFAIEEELEFDPPSDDLVWSLTLKWQIKTIAPHPYLYFYSTAAAESALNGWYLAIKVGASWSDLATLPDETGLFNGRQHAKLTQVG